MRFSMLISLIRPIGPVIVGISLGFTLSLLSVTWVDESCDSDGIAASEDILLGQPGSLKGARKPSSISTSTTENGDAEEDFEPRIVPYTKPAQPSQSKKVFRYDGPRHTEANYPGVMDIYLGKRNGGRSYYLLPHLATS